MKYSAIQILLSLAASALGADSSDVVDLTSSTFQEYVNSHNLVLAEFYAPWCGHCKNLAPEYEQAATALKGRSEDISLAKIDCVGNQDICTEHGVGGFPTIYVFENGKKAGQYQGPRKADDITQYMIKRSLPVVTDLKNGEGVETWLSENLEKFPITFLYLGPKDSYKEYVEAANTFRERATFISVNDDKLKEKYGGAELVVFKDGEGEKVPVNSLPKGSELTVKTISAFFKNNEFPAFGTLGPENYSAYVENGTPMLYAFVNTSEQIQMIDNAITPHLQLLNGKVNVVLLNSSIYGAHAENVNLRQEFPAMVIHDVVSNKKYVHNQDTPLSQESISDFVKKFAAGEIEPYIKSEPVPESQDEAVHVLVGSEFDKIVYDETKDVLVEFYAPWCGHCKNLKPIYEELAQHFQDNKNIVIAKLDHTLNDVPDQISGYPTIKFYPAGTKDSPIVFEGARTLSGFISFLQDNSNFVSDDSKSAPEKVEKSKKSKKDLKDEL